MDARILLADYAQVDPNGKVHAIGLGWTRTTTPVGNMGIIVILEFDQDEAEGHHTADVTLLDEDGFPAQLEQPEGDDVQPRFSARFTIGPIKDEKSDFPITHPFAVNLPPGMPVEAGGIYTWQVSIDDHTDPRWQVRFRIDDSHPVRQDG